MNRMFQRMKLFFNMQHIGHWRARTHTQTTKKKRKLIEAVAFFNSSLIGLHYFIRFFVLFCFSSKMFIIN